MELTKVRRDPIADFARLSAPSTSASESVFRSKGKGNGECRSESSETWIAGAVYAIPEDLNGEVGEGGVLDAVTFVGVKTIFFSRSGMARPTALCDFSSLGDSFAATTSILGNVLQLVSTARRRPYGA